MDMDYNEEDLAQMKPGKYLLQCVSAVEKVSEKGNPMTEFNLKVIKEYETGSNACKGEELRYWLVRSQDPERMKYYFRNARDMRISAGIPEDQKGVKHTDLVGKVLLAVVDYDKKTGRYLNVMSFLERDDEPSAEDAIFANMEDAEVSDEDFDKF